MSGYDLGMVHSLLGDISGQLRDILRDCSCSGSSDLSVELLGAHSSDYLTQQLFSCTQLLSKCESVLQISSVEISRIKDTVISLQDEKLKASQGGESVISATPQSQIGVTSYSGILQVQQPSTTQVRKQSSTFTSVQGDCRDQNVMIFGVPERQDETTDAVVENIFSQMGEKPHFVHCVRVGVNVSAEKPRPIKVEMRNANMASQTIMNGRKLREISGTKGIYVGPDRTPEQRATRRRLVATIRERRKSDPEHFHFIRGRSVLSRDRFVSASEAPEGDSDSPVMPAKDDQLVTVVIDSESDDDQGSCTSECSSASSLCRIPFTAKQEEALRKHREQNALETKEIILRRIREARG